MTALLVGSSATAAPPTPTRRRGGGLWRSVLSSKKAVVGLALFLIFCILAVAPGLFTSVDDPNKLQFDPSLSPSADHWLGTTSLGQDIWAQLVYGTRESLVIALVAGAGATVLSVLIGVSAAYLGGIADDVLSMLTNIFLVLPTFPLDPTRPRRLMWFLKATVLPRFYWWGMLKGREWFTGDRRG